MAPTSACIAVLLTFSPRAVAVEHDEQRLLGRARERVAHAAAVLVDLVRRRVRRVARLDAVARERRGRARRRSTPRPPRRSPRAARGSPSAAAAAAAPSAARIALSPSLPTDGEEPISIAAIASSSALTVEAGGGGGGCSSSSRISRESFRVRKVARRFSGGGSVGGSAGGEVALSAARSPDESNRVIDERRGASGAVSSCMARIQRWRARPRSLVVAVTQLPRAWRCIGRA